jgi:uncharacterized membrane protein YhaH (DUF805 family)
MALIGYVALTALVALALALALAALILKRARDSTGSWTPEHIAYNLFTMIARTEQKALFASSKGDNPDRKWLLDTYAECIQAVKEPDKRLNKSKP